MSYDALLQRDLLLTCEPTNSMKGSIHYLVTKSLCPLALTFKQYYAYNIM